MIFHNRCTFGLITLFTTICFTQGDSRCLTMLEEVTEKRIVDVNGRSIDITFELTKGITQRLTSRIMKIFIVEVLGYSNVKLIEQIDDNLIDYDSNEDFERFADNLLPQESDSIPKVMVNMEVWIPSHLKDPLYFKSKHVTESEIPTGPPGYFGWFIPKSLWESKKNDVTWNIFVKERTASEFNVDDKILSLIKSHTLMSTGYDERYYCSDDYCKEGIYVPERCNNSNIKCAMLLSTYPESTSFVKKDIEELNLFVNVAWVGPNLNNLIKIIVDYYKLNNTKKSLVILDGTPSDVVPNDNDDQFITITFPKCKLKKFTDTCKYENHRLVKLVWSSLYDIAKIPYQAIDKASFESFMYTDLINRWNNKNDTISEHDIACDWIKDNLNYTEEYWKPKTEKYKNHLTIGGIFPVTGESYTSRTILLAAQMAEKAIENTDTVLANDKLTVWGSDGECKSEMVLKSFIDYLLYHGNTLVGILGPACSETIEPLIGLSKTYSTMIVSYSAEGSSFNDRNKYPYFFRTIGENSYYKNVYLNIFKTMKWQRIAALTEDGQKHTEYISQMHNSYFSKYNITFIDNVKYPRKRSKDDIYKSLENLKRKRARIIIVDMFNDKVAREIMCAAYKLDMTAYEGYVWFLPLWLSPNWWDVDDIKKVSNSSETESTISCTTAELRRSTNGYFGISHANYAPDDSIMQENITVRKWRDNYEAVCRLHNQPPSEYASYAYDATWTYAYAVDKLLKEDERHRTSLRSKVTVQRLADIISQTDFQGVSGRIKFVNGASRISPVNIIQHVHNETRKIGMFIPNNFDYNETVIDGAGYLDINISAIVWLNEGKTIPDDGTQPEIKCVLNGFAELINVTCELAIVIVNLIGFGCFGMLLIVGFIILKKKYENKMRLQERYIKSLGIDLLQTDTSGLDKWEIPRECVVINRKLGEGAFGTVYGGEAFFSEKGWLAVAVKTLKVGSSTEEKLDFLSEVEVMKRFDHKNVIKLLGVCIKCEPVYTVMEFMLYGDLKTYLLARRHLVNDRNYEDYDEISSKKLTAMALDVARALSYLAQLKYVHRDIASRNCLVNAQRVVKLGDFGMTRPMYESDYYRFNRKGMLPVRWMAPESLGLGIFTPASDVWSYGVLLYEIITFGSFPFQGLSNNEVLEHVKCGNTINIPSGIKSPLESLIRSCWTIDYKSRPKAPEIVDFLATNPRLLSPCLDVPLASVQLEHTGKIDMQLPEKFRKFSVSLNKKNSTTTTTTPTAAAPAALANRSNSSSVRNKFDNNRLVLLDTEEEDDRNSMINCNKNNPNFGINSKYNSNNSNSNNINGNNTINNVVNVDSSSSRLPLLCHNNESNCLNDDGSKYVQLQRSINSRDNDNDQYLARYVNIQPGGDHSNDNDNDIDDEINRISLL